MILYLQSNDILVLLIKSLRIGTFITSLIFGLIVVQTNADEAACVCWLVNLGVGVTRITLRRCHLLLMELTKLGLVQGLGGDVNIVLEVIAGLQRLILISNLLIGVELLIAEPGIHVYHIVVNLRLGVQVQRNQI